MELLNDVGRLRDIVRDSIFRWSVFDSDEIPEFLSDINPSRQELLDAFVENNDALKIQVDDKILSFYLH